MAGRRPKSNAYSVTETNGRGRWREGGWARRFIGSEIEERYFHMAVRRIADALKQPDLFLARCAPAKQEAFDL